MASSTAITGTRQFGARAMRVLAGAPQVRHQFCSGASSARHTGQRMGAGPGPETDEGGDETALTVPPSDAAVDS